MACKDNIIEIEMQKLNIFYHLKRCKHNYYGNCKFIDTIIDIYIENFQDEKNGINNLQNFCREYFGSFFSLTTLISSLAIIERKKAELEKEFKNLLIVSNEM